MERHELFLEIGTEELPAGYIAPAVAQLADLLKEQLAQGRIEAGEVKTFATPRRLVVVFAQVASQGRDEVEEVNGPPVRVAFDEDGNPRVPAQKFAERFGLSVEELERVETPKGEYLMARVMNKGRRTLALLGEVLPELLGRLTFPKTMRWGREKTLFARPVHWICALFGGERVPFAFAGIESGRESRGHRFMAPATFEVTDAAQYEAACRERYVVLDPQERRDVIREQGEALAASCDGVLVRDDELLELNAFLVEYARPLLARFEEKYLALPPELLRTSVRHHLKCFVVEDGQGKLLPFMVTVAGLISKTEEKVRDGVQRVLRARLADAQFFYDEDRRQRLESRVARLDDVVFQSKLGSYGDKIRRLEAQSVAAAEALGYNEVAGEVQRAAHLCKADLVSQMVFEFPELQGTMGRYYALHDEEPSSVAEAIAEHYLPAGQDDPVPASATGQVLALIDRLDTLVGGLGVGLKTSGSADPYGLRRQAVGVLRILKEHKLPASLGSLIAIAREPLADKLNPKIKVEREVISYLRGRLEQILRRDDWPRDLIDAVCVDALVARRPIAALEALLAALQEAVQSGVLAGLAYSFKRVNNILRAAAKKKIIPHYPGLGDAFFSEEEIEIPSEHLVEEEEKALYKTFQEVRGEVLASLDKGEFSEALTRLLALQQPIDLMFDEVMVMAKEPTLRDTRLALMRAIAGLAFVDFSRIKTDLDET